MELYSIHLFKREDHSNFKLVLDKLLEHGMKESSNLRKEEKPLLQPHLIMLTEAEELEVSFHQTLH